MQALRRRAAAGLGAALAVAVGGAAAAGAATRGGARGSVAPKRVSAASMAGNRARADSDVRALLGLARLPAGAVRLTRAPKGAAAIDNEQPNEMTPNLADAHSWWRVRGTLDAVLAYLKAHPPRGSTSSGSGIGSSTLPRSTTTTTVGDVTSSFPARLGVLDSRTLIVKAVSVGADVVAVRVDAEDAWEIPRSGSERIPAGVHEIDVVRAVAGRASTVSEHVLDAGKVAAIVKLIDALPVVQPGAIGCPMIPAGAPRVTLSFRAKSGGAVLARASQLALALETPTACDSVSLTIGGHAQTPLLAGSGFLVAVGKVLGVPLAAST
jgi:hypothetical protein